MLWRLAVRVICLLLRGFLATLLNLQSSLHLGCHMASPCGCIVHGWQFPLSRSRKASQVVVELIGLTLPGAYRQGPKQWPLGLLSSHLPDALVFSVAAARASQERPVQLVQEQKSSVRLLAGSQIAANEAVWLEGSKQVQPEQATIRLWQTRAVRRDGQSAALVVCRRSWSPWESGSAWKFNKLQNLEI